MNGTLQVIFGLCGGLAMFLYGMNSMSDALQKAAGEKMRKILGFLTRNPLMGALAGALVTAVLQSSSATTVMVIGFVSAGLMSMPQGISVIFGANIGTTMTAQLLAFKISDYILPIIFIGFILYFIFKSEKVKNIGMVIFSFGLLFEGIEIMGSVMKPLASSEFFINLMGQVSNMPILGVGLGALMTLVVQSSSATIAVLQNFASQAGPDGVTSVIGLAGAIPILLGDNIGTTITALIASIGQSKNAKRTAIAHTVFNVSGSALFICIIPLMVKFITFISPKGPEVEVISRQIANAHTTFNVTMTLIWLPLIPLMVKIVTWIIRGEDRDLRSENGPKFLDDRMFSQPEAALFLVSKEIQRLTDLATDAISFLKENTINKSDEAIGNFNRKQESVKDLGDAISNYITRLFAGGALSGAQAEQTAGLMFVSGSITRTANRCRDISDILATITSEENGLSEKACEELKHCIEILQDMFTKSTSSLAKGDKDLAVDVITSAKKVRKAQKKSTRSQLQLIANETGNPELTAAYSDILINIDRIAEACTGIAEETLDGIGYVDLSENELEAIRQNNAVLSSFR